MKKYFLILMILFMFGCASNIQKFNIIIKNNYHKITLVEREMPEITLLVPKYALSKIKDIGNTVSLISVSKNNEDILMIYFEKDGPNFADPGHSVAIIFSKEKRSPLFFSTTIKEDQNFFYYNEIGIPIETTKVDYSRRLQFSIDGVNRDNEGDIVIKNHFKNIKIKE